MGRKQPRFQPNVRLVHLFVFVWSTFSFAYLYPSVGNGLYSDGTFQANVATPPQKKLPTLRQLTTSYSDLQSMKKSVNFNCTNLNRKYIVNIDREEAAIQKNHSIAKSIHQTSKSRCVTLKVGNAIQRWRSLSDFDFSYYFHDDDAVQALFQQFSHIEFPLLKQIVEHCLIDGTLKADLWRYLILWLYGGIYADIDTIPNQLNVTEIVHHDAYFVVEQYHLLSQWFMAISPRHPLMYYAIQHSLSNILRATDVSRIAAPLNTGPHALHAAFVQFRRDHDPTVDRSQPVRAGHYAGTNNRTITVVGTADQESQYVRRDVLGVLKKKEYRKMGMNHFSEVRSNATGVSCMSTMFYSTL
jgi:mannosyltransferase OCH1-like enzyme